MNKTYIIVRVWDAGQGNIALLNELEEAVCDQMSSSYYIPLGAPFRFDGGWAQAMYLKEKWDGRS